MPARARTAAVAALGLLAAVLLAAPPSALALRRAAATCALEPSALPLEVASEEGLAALCAAACDLREAAEGADEVKDDGDAAGREDNVALAFGLVAAAGASTSVGAAFVFCDGVVTRANRFVLAGSLGFSAGVMLYVSLVEIFVKAVDEFAACECLWEHEDPSAPARIMTTIIFFVGIVLFLGIDWCIHYMQGRTASLRKDDKAVESSSSSASTAVVRQTSLQGHEKSAGASARPAGAPGPLQEKEAKSPKGPGKSSREALGESILVSIDIDTVTEAPDMISDGTSELALADAANAGTKSPLSRRREDGVEPSSQVQDLGHDERDEVQRHEQMEKALPPSVPFGSPSEDHEATLPIERAAHMGFSSELIDQKMVSREAREEEDKRRARRRELQRLAHGHGHSHGHAHGRGLGHDDDAAAGAEGDDEGKLHSMGIMTAVAIGLHNFPEGLATFVATLADPTVGVGLAVAIAVHNIPEGLCVSIPIYYSTGNRTRGFVLATLSGFAEIVGAFLGWVALASTFSSEAYAALFALVSGMMVAIVMKELIPTAHRYDPRDCVTTMTIVGGMAVMAVSLCLFLV